MIITTSWDDGYPADRRLAALLIKYNITGTFYIPGRNSEGREVSSASDIKELSDHFEIGAHTLSHVDLTKVPSAEAARQISEGKKGLEDLLGKRIYGFCYPRGRYNSRVRQIAIDNGFAYARTVKNLCFDIGSDRFSLPVTVQFFPHKRNVYLKNLLGYGPSLERSRLMFAAIATAKLVDRVKHLIDICIGDQRVFHLWGHSWEIDEQNLWDELEEVFRYFHNNFPRGAFMTNHELALRSYN
jgi:hypothetical protein